MKLYNISISVILMVCLMSLVYAAPETTRNWSSDGGHHGSIAGHVGQSTSIVTSSNKATDAAVTAVTGSATFTPIPTTGNAIDNTKKVAVYIAAMTNPVYSETLMKYTPVPVTYDPLTTSLLYEYNPAYISDSNLKTLTTANYELLIVPMSQMSTGAAKAISNYIASGGSVWFLNDPSMTPDGTGNVQLTGLLGNGVRASTSSSTTINVINTDPITAGLPASFKPIGAIAKTSQFRSLTGSGTISGLNYQVLMSSYSAAILIKFENSTTGARVIYSNPDMFISGGTASYFNAQTATRLFMQTKAWVMKLALNGNGVFVTYPKSDKQFTVTCDDVEAADWEDTIMNAMFDQEIAVGVSPSSVNTLFIIPDIYTTADELAYYAKNGDTHTLHPHQTPEGNGYIWDNTGTSVSTYIKDITNSKNIINKVVSSSDYGFTSWRFPMTTFCANSMQAVSNSGFIIESSSGIGTDGIQIGNIADNTVLMPKQMLINNAKTNLIEIEIPASFDIDCTSGTDFYNQYNAYTNQFKGINFPSNFIVGCHYQGAGSNTLLGSGITATGLTAGLGKIITAEKAANPNYATFNTLANYINGIKTAKITATSTSTETTVTVVNSQPITDFTLKVAIGGVTSATCDNVAIPASNIKTDSLTGSTYVTQTITAGTHTFVLSTTGSLVPSDNVIPVASFTPTAVTSAGPITATFTSTSTDSPSPSL